MHSARSIFLDKNRLRYSGEVTERLQNVWEHGFCFLKGFGLADRMKNQKFKTSMKSKIVHRMFFQKTLSLWSNAKIQDFTESRLPLKLRGRGVVV